jgi:hypothetical protein
MIFRRLNHREPEALTLVRGINGEHAEVSAFSSNLDVDRGENTSRGVLSDEETSGLHLECQVVLVGARAINKGFNRKSSVGDGNDGGRCYFE